MYLYNVEKDFYFFEAPVKVFEDCLLWFLFCKAGTSVVTTCWAIGHWMISQSHTE